MSHSNQEDFENYNCSDKGLTPLYTKASIEGMFNKHITIEFKKDTCRFPKGMKRHDNIDIKIIGEYIDKDISAYQVEISLCGKDEWVTHQIDSDTPLHITMECKNDVKPFMSGIRIKNGLTKNYSEKEYKYGKGTLSLFQVRD